jgi:hypothetical protein
VQLGGDGMQRPGAAAGHGQPPQLLLRPGNGRGIHGDLNGEDLPGAGPSADTSRPQRPQPSQATSPLTVDALVAAVGREAVSTRTAAERVLERPATPAEVERARRRLAVAIRDGRLRAYGVDFPNGVVTMYEAATATPPAVTMTRPATG